MYTKIGLIILKMMHLQRMEKMEGTLISLDGMARYSCWLNLVIELILFITFFACNRIESIVICLGFRLSPQIKRIDIQYKPVLLYYFPDV